MFKKSLFFLMIAYFVFNGQILRAEIHDHRVHAPQSNTDEFVVFKPQMLTVPFEISYPGTWYASEEDRGAQNTALVLTPSKIVDFHDPFDTGMTLYCYPAYFTKRTEDWPAIKSKLLESIQKKKVTVQSSSDMPQLHEKAFRVDYASADTAIIAVYVRDGDNLYNFLFQVPSAKKASFAPIFEKMLLALNLKK